MKKLALGFPGAPGTIEEWSSQVFQTESGSQWKLGFPGGPGSARITPAFLINKLLPYLFVIAGLVLFFMLIFGGFTIFISAGNPEKIKKGTGMITNALVGFLIIISAYWIIQFLEYSLGIKVFL